MLFSLKDQTVLVTGASGSIGRAISIAMAEQGAEVAITGTRERALIELQEEIKEKTGKEAQIFVCNLSESEDIKHLVENVSNRFGKLDILVNNAGINKDMLFARMTEEDFDQVMKVNLNAAFQLTKEAIQVMSDNRYGRIINITSVVAFTGNIGQVNYCASKAALVGMSRAIALEVARKGITVNCVAPGAINSPMIEKLSDASKEKFLAKIPMKKVGEPGEVATTCCFLASKEAGYITGQTIHVNGGMYM